MSDLARKYDIRNPRSSDPPPCHAELALSLEGRSEASYEKNRPAESPDRTPERQKTRQAPEPPRQNRRGQNRNGNVVRMNTRSESEHLGMRTYGNWEQVGIEP